MASLCALNSPNEIGETIDGVGSFVEKSYCAKFIFRSLDGCEVVNL